MSVIGAATVAIRFWEFAHLNVRWDQNAYGSILWLLLGLHATHLITDLGRTTGRLYALSTAGSLIGTLLGLEMMRRVDPDAVTDEMAIAAMRGVVAATTTGVHA